MNYNEQLREFKKLLLETTDQEKIQVILNEFSRILKLKYGAEGLAYEYNLLNSRPRDENFILTPMIDVVNKAIAD